MVVGVDDRFEYGRVGENKDGLIKGGGVVNGGNKARVCGEAVEQLYTFCSSLRRI